MVKQTSKGRGRGARSSNTSSSSLAAPASPGVSRFVFKIKMDEEQAQTYSPIKKLPVQVGKIKFTKDRLQDWKASRCFHTSSSKINLNLISDYFANCKHVMFHPNVPRPRINLEQDGSAAAPRPLALPHLPTTRQPQRSLPERGRLGSSFWWQPNKTSSNW